jgi:hypothetical protein
VVLDALILQNLRCTIFGATPSLQQKSGSFAVSVSSTLVSSLDSSSPMLEIDEFDVQAIWFSLLVSGWSRTMEIEQNLRNPIVMLVKIEKNEEKKPTFCCFRELGLAANEWLRVPLRSCD